MSDDILFTQIQTAMKTALKTKDQRRLAAVRLIMAAIKQFEIDSRTEGQTVAVTDNDIIGLLDKMVKQRRDALEQYQQAARQDLAEQEAYEITIIEEFLPKALSETELDDLITQAISNTGAESMRDMGKVMAELKPQITGRADMKQVSAKVKQKLDWLSIKASS